MSEQTAAPGGKLRVGRLPVGMVGKRTSGWWGVIMLVAAEAVLFVYLLFSYYYFAFQHGREWLPAELPHFKLSAPNTAILILSSVAVWFGERGAHRGSRGQLLGGLSVGFVLVFIQYKEWMGKHFSIASHSYGSLFFTVTGFHMAHVLAGLLVLLPLILWSAMGYFDRHRSSAISIGALYWHFVDVVWLTVFFTFYVTPHLTY